MASMCPTGTPDLETALQKPICDLSIAAIAAAQTFMRFKLPFLLTSPDETLGGDDHRSAPNDHDVVSGIVFGTLRFFAGFLCRVTKRADEMPSGPSQYERLGTIHAGLDPLEYIKRELYEIEVTIADLKETGMLRN